MTPKKRTLPGVLRTALQPSAPHCYRHCDRPVRARALAVGLPGVFQAYACPGGAVSVVSYFELSDRDPTPELTRILRRLVRPARLVRARDLRTATRRGPELGRRAERLLARTDPAVRVRGAYWRLYPFKDRRGVERRLFSCFRHRDPPVVFFVAPANSECPPCPECAPPARRSPGSPTPR